MKLAILLLNFVSAINLLAQAKPAADLIISNARVWTVDKAHPTAQAVAVLGDRMIAVGLDADVESLRGPATKVMRAASCFCPASMMLTCTSSVAAARLMRCN
jgi:hypothetical protein